MKITPQNQKTLRELLKKNAIDLNYSSLIKFVFVFDNEVKNGNIKAKSCVATNCFSGLAKGEALDFICNVIYRYANDSHLKTFYKKLYNELSTSEERKGFAKFALRRFDGLYYNGKAYGDNRDFGAKPYLYSEPCANDEKVRFPRYFDNCEVVKFYDD